VRRPQPSGHQAEEPAGGKAGGVAGRHAGARAGVVPAPGRTPPPQRRSQTCWTGCRAGHVVVSQVISGGWPVSVARGPASRRRSRPPPLVPAGAVTLLGEREAAEERDTQRGALSGSRRRPSLAPGKEES
jgi:hypothetical protein